MRDKLSLSQIGRRKLVAFGVITRYSRIVYRRDKDTNACARGYKNLCDVTFRLFADGNADA